MHWRKWGHCSLIRNLIEFHLLWPKNSGRDSIDANQWPKIHWRKRGYCSPVRNPAKLCFCGRIIVVEIAPMPINNPKSIDVNEVIVHQLGILQSFIFCGRKAVVKITWMPINNPKCIDVNEVTIRPLGILQSLVFCDIKVVAEIAQTTTNNQQPKMHWCKQGYYSPVRNSIELYLFW